jgi:hypothetical protein
MDCDPRDDYDSRDDECFGPDGQNRGGSDDDRDWDDWRQPEIASRDRDDEARDLGCGPGDSRQSNNDKHGHNPRDAERWPDRVRHRGSRDVFTRDLDLPRGREREIVHDRDREYTLRGSESRRLATVGAFRVVSRRDLRDHGDRPADPRSGDLRHLRDQGLVETTRVLGSRDYAVSLTKEGRSLPEGHRDRDQEGSQTFYAGVKRERELEHDVQVYRAFEREAERLEQRGTRIDRVVSTTSSSVSTRRGSTSAIATVISTTAIPTAMAARSRSGLTSTTCRTSTSRSISLICGSNTRKSTAAPTTGMSRS